MAGGDEIDIEQLKSDFAAQLAAKESIIQSLNERISALQTSIDNNQSAILNQINENYIDLNSKVLGSTESSSKRKKANGATSTSMGPIDKFIISSNDSHNLNSNSVCMNEDSVNSSAAIVSDAAHDLNSTQQPVVQPQTASIGGASFATVAAKNIAKPMPLQLGVTDRITINQIIDLLCEFDKDDFDFIQLKGGSPPRIFPKNSIVKSQMINVFRENNIEFNTYSEDGEKRQTYIVRGLNYGDDSTNITLICCSIADVGFLGGVDCSRFLTGQMKRGGDVNQAVLYRFTLDAKVNESSLLQIKSINGYRVTIEKMRKSVVIQRHRCQRFQHTFKSCSFEYRCEQCVVKHGPGLCPRTTNNCCRD